MPSTGPPDSTLQNPAALTPRRAWCTNTNSIRLTRSSIRPRATRAPAGASKVHRTFTHTPPALRMPLVGCGHGSRTRDHDLAVAPAQAGDRSRRARRQEERDVAARRRAPADAGRPDADGDAIDGSNVARRVGVGGRLLRKRTRRWRQGSPNVHAHASSTSHAARRLRAWES